MAWEARLGLKLEWRSNKVRTRWWLNGLGSPFGIETSLYPGISHSMDEWLNGLGSPFGIETVLFSYTPTYYQGAKWPGKPVWD